MKRLVLRLSSLGDVILASAVLEVSNFTNQNQIDWVVATSFRGVLTGHPKIHRLFEFDRSQGIGAWIKTCRILWKENYHEIFDLHRNLRTRLMKALFFYWSFKERASMPLWKTISKQRIQLNLYYLGKKLYPKKFRPQAWVQRYTQFVGGSGLEHPNLRHLSLKQALPRELLDSLGAKRKYICVMPSSRWEGKKWPVESYLQVLKQMPFLPVILGQKSDSESVLLVQLLQNEGISHFSAVGSTSLAQTAKILEGAVFYLGSDTGLAHLSEAVGTSSKVILGPTTEDMGFGPWMPESESIGLSLWCRPCGKDGQSCFRISNRYLCLKGLSPDKVLNLLHSTQTEKQNKPQH